MIKNNVTWVETLRTTVFNFKMWGLKMFSRNRLELCQFFSRICSAKQSKQPTSIVVELILRFIATGSMCPVRPWKYQDLYKLQPFSNKQFVWSGLVWLLSYVSRQFKKKICVYCVHQFEEINSRQLKKRSGSMVSTSLKKQTALYQFKSPYRHSYGPVKSGFLWAVILVKMQQQNDILAILCS